MGTTPKLIKELIDTAVIEPTPPLVVSGKGRPPLYAPMVAHILSAAPEVVVYGPFEGVAGRIVAERIRTGCYSYAHDHPEVLPPGKVLRLSVRQERGMHRLFAWVEDADHQEVA